MISLAVGTVLPILVGFFTTEKLNPGLKAAILAAISGVSAVLSQWANAINAHAHFAWPAALLSAFVTWGVGEATYFKWWKPGGVSDYVQSKGVTSSPTVDEPVDSGGSSATTGPVDAVDTVVVPVQSPLKAGRGRHEAS